MRISILKITSNPANCNMVSESLFSSDLFILYFFFSLGVIPLTWEVPCFATQAIEKTPAGMKIAYNLLSSNLA